MKKILLLSAIFTMVIAGGLLAQPNIFNPNDTIVTYNPSKPPATPPANTMAKWVRTVRMSFNTSRFKAYYFNGVAFRVRFPNNYNAADVTKKYPAILFFHGAGENASIYDNDLQLIHGAQRFETSMNGGNYDAFMIFPQMRNDQGGAYDYNYYVKLGNILDSLQKYCRLDPDQVTAMGLSSGGFAAISFTANFPQRVSTVIASSPALINLVIDRQENMVEIPFWISSGGQDANPDSASTQKFVDSFKYKGADIRWSFFPSYGHDTWNAQWDQSSYLYAYWNATHKANPVVYFQRTQFCADSAISARMGLTWGFYQYQWQRNGIDIAGATSNEYTATQFGTYRARFKRLSTSEWSDWSKVPVVISARAATATPDIKISGMRSKVLPAADGSTTVPLELPEGYGSYEWRRTSDNVLVSTQRVFEAPAGTFKGLVAGCSRTFSPAFTVTNANGTPKPNAAFNLTIARVNATSIKLTWSDQANPTSDETGFEIYRRSTATGAYTLIYINPANNKTYTDLTSGSFNYYYAIRSVNATGAAALSNQATLQPSGDATAPTVPANVKVVLTGRNAIDLDWDNSFDSVGVTAYDIYINDVKKYSTTVSQFTVDSLTPNTTYSFTIKALDQAGNSSAFSAATSGKTVVNGIKYRYYAGSWTVLPNFNTLTPVKTGTSANINVGDRPTGVNDNYGFVWEGYLNIVTPGNYTFDLVSDDGSKFYFNTFYSPTATALVNNDGAHASQLATGTVNATAAGYYPVTITYFENTGGENMQLYWSGPGITRQLVPDSAFTENYRLPADNIAPSAPANLKAVFTSRKYVDLDWNNATDNVGVTRYDVYVNNVKKYTSLTSDITIDSLVPNTAYTFSVKAADMIGNVSAFSNVITVTTGANGLKYTYYEGDWNVLPDFDTLTAIKSGAVANVDLSVRNVNDFFGIKWEGYINIKTAGTYTFELASDDGSKLYFNSFYSPSATALVSSDGLHAPTPVSGSINVTTPGLYPIAFTYFEKNSGEAMQVYWAGPGIPRQLIPNAAFTETYQLPVDNVAPTTPANLKSVFLNSTSINLDWDNSTDNVAVTRYDVYVNNVKKYSTTTSDITADSLSPNTTYTFTVKAVDQAGNNSAFSNSVVAKTTSSASGLKYRYFEGTWDALPNFNALTAIKTGNTPNIDMSVRNVNDNFGFVWEGVINIKTPGTYTFELISDDGSKLYFNTTYGPAATALVNNDGLHGPQSVTGSVNVATAGLYPITMAFFERDGGETMQVYWTGPGIPRQLIPDEAFTSNFQLPQDNVAPTVPANLKVVQTNRTFIDLDWDNSSDNTGVTRYDVYVNNVKKYSTTTSNISADSLLPNTSYTFTVKAFDLAGNSSAFSAAVTASTTNIITGLKYKYYEGSWDALPNFSTMTPVKTGNTPNIDMSVRQVNDNFGFVWEGYINIKTPGNYTFELVSDDGSKLYFNSTYNFASTALVNNDYLHGPASATGTVNIAAAGAYPIAMAFFEKDGGETMEVYWTGPGITRQRIPDSVFKSGTIITGQVATNGTISGSSDNDASLSTIIAGSGNTIAKAYPNPFNQQFSVAFHNSTAANHVRIEMFDLSGKMVQSNEYSKLPAGDNRIAFDLGKDKQLKSGMYVVRLSINGIPSTIWKMVKENK